MSDPDSQEPLSNLSENSFVILGQDSLAYHINDENNENSDSLLKSKTTCNGYESAALNSSDKFQSKLWSGNNLSEEEIQRKLDELIKENYLLKETLTQNNLAIKSQLDTFVMWQQEVLKTHETHKQKFLETKDLILKLRAENASLKKHLEESSENGSDIYAQVNKKPEDVVKLKQKIEEYERMCNELNVRNDNLDAENQKLKEDLRIAKMEILKLNKELEDVGRENTFLKQHKNDSTNKNSSESISYKSLPSSEARAQISNLFEQLELEKGKVLKLTKELEKTKSNDTEPQRSKLSTSEKLNQYIDKLNNMHDSFDKQSQRYSSLSSWVSLAEQNLKENKVNKEVETDLVGEINLLKSHLNEEGNLFREKQESLLELKKQFHKLLEDYKVLQLKLISLKNNDTTIEKQKEEISNLQMKLEAKDKEIQSMQQEYKTLGETAEKFKLEWDENATLSALLQLYQSDLKEEQEAKKKLAIEKEELAEQVRYFQIKIKSLEEGNLKNGDSVASPPKSSVNKTSYKCPRCMNSFPNLSEVEQHVEECIKDDFF